MKKHYWLIAILAVCYALTWIFGWRSHAHEIEARAERLWLAADSKNREYATLASKTGEFYDPIRLLKNGPATSVDWCVPILPGVLIADSSYVVGPLYGKGGIKLVILYGFGSSEYFIAGWNS